MKKNYDQSGEINYDTNWSYIPDHPYRILIMGGSGSEKTNDIDIDRTYLYVKDLFKSNCQLPINGR